MASIRSNDRNRRATTLGDRKQRAVSILRGYGIGVLVQKLIQSMKLQARLAAAPLIARLSPKTFRYDGKDLAYFNRRYNATCINERAVEVPIVLDLMRDFAGLRILEVGCVLPHYFDHTWDVVDRFEVRSRVLSIDIVDFRPAKQYDLIVSISTLKHIGFDDEYDPSKFHAAVTNIQQNCLKAGGLLVATMPIGYNPNLDQLIFGGRSPFQRHRFLKRTSWIDLWVEVSATADLANVRCNEPYPCANGLVVVYLESASCAS
jgi:hypothetical protein